MTIVNGFRAAWIAAKTRLQYRLNFFMTLFSTLMFCTLYYMVWKAVYAGSAPSAMSWPELVTYVMMGQVASFTRFSIAERGPIFRMAERIYSGDISLDLIRPIGFQMQRFVEAAGFMMVEIVWVILPAWAWCMIFFGILPPAGPAAAVWFIVSLLSAFLVSFGLNSILMMLNFYTVNAQGLHKAKKAIVEILAGSLIPFQFFPDSLRRICEYLPFASMAWTPISIYNGTISGMGISTAILSQLAWAAVMLGISRLVWIKASRKITIFGG